MRTAEDTKQFIIEVTADIFNKQGYVGTSLSDLTRATNLTKGGIYGNFENKNDVAVTVYEYNIRRLLGNLEDQLRYKKTAFDKFSIYLNYYESHVDTILKMGGCPLLNTGTDVDDTHPDLKLHVQNNLHQWKLHLIETMEIGIKEKEIKSDVVVDEFVDVFIATIEGGLFLAKMSDDKQRFLHSINFLRKQVLAILTTKP